MENPSQAYKIMPIAWVYGLLGAVVFFLAWDQDAAFYFVLGTAVSLFNYSLLVRHVRNMKPEAGFKGMYGNYVIRYIMYGLVLGYVYLSDAMPYVIPTVVGMMGVKVALMLFVVYNHFKKKKEA